MNFFGELKRRNVFRMAGVYGVVGWLIIQVIATVKGPLHLPDWIDTLVVVGVLGGFPIALLFSWAFEVTPDGLKRTKDVPENASIAAETAKRLDIITIGGLALVLTVIGVDRFLLPKQTVVVAAAPAAVETVTVATEAPAPVSDKSIAVLPFQNRSESKSDAFFAEGMHDDLLTQLSKVSALRVISRTSMAQYVDTKMSIPEIAKELGVAMILEGAVQRAGDHVRINVQLIDGATDKHLWAEIYDREMTVANVFAIQTDITETITDALKVAITGEEKIAIAALPTENVKAYDAYLLGKTLYASDQRDPDVLAQSVAALDEAIALDPEFAAAYATKARILLGLVWWNFDSAANLARAEEAIAHAKALAPAAFETRLAEARYLYAGKLEFKAAREAYKELLPLAPNNTELWWEYATAERRLGDFKAAIGAFEHVVSLSPNDANNLATLAQTFSHVGEWRKFQAAIKRARALAPDSFYVQLLELQGLSELGDVDILWDHYENTRAAPGADIAFVDDVFGGTIAPKRLDAARLSLLADRLAPFTDDDAALTGTTLIRAEILQRLGREREAQAIVEATAARLDGMAPTAADEDDLFFARISIMAMRGERAELIAAIEKYREENKDNVLTAYGAEPVFASLLAGVGEAGRAFDIYEKLADEFSPGLVGYMVTDYEFDPYQGDPRYKALVVRYKAWRKREGID